MKRNKLLKRRLRYRRFSLLCFIGLIVCAACQKIEYTKMDAPAYLRVFNSLNLPKTFEAAVTDSLPLLCMLINPVFDEEGIPISAEIVGDFLNVRDKYAPPYPVHIGVSTSKLNPEYPGKETVLVGPVLNGFDLSSWAQVPSGKANVVFMLRPLSNTDFFSLAKEYKRSKIAEGTFDLDAGEIYTMNVIYENIETKAKNIYLRKENFQKLALSDSLIYVNFYNYSANNYQNAAFTDKVPKGKAILFSTETGIQDAMDIYFSAMEGQDFVNYGRVENNIVNLRNEKLASPFYERKYLGTLYRSTDNQTAATYYPIPLRVKKNGQEVYSDLWQRFYFFRKGMSVDEKNQPYPEYRPASASSSPLNPNGDFAVINCVLNGPMLYYPNIYASDGGAFHFGLSFPNLMVNTHSGTDRLKSFATVNSFEFINGEVYLMTIQRKYAPPIY